MEQLKAATEKENVRIEEQKAKIDEQLKEVQPLIDVSSRFSESFIQLQYSRKLDEPLVL